MMRIAKVMCFFAMSVVFTETEEVRNYHGTCTGTVPVRTLLPVHVYEWTIKTDLCFPTYILTIAYHILAIKVVVQFVVCCVSSLVSTYVDTYYHCYSIVAYFSHVYRYSTVVIRYMFVE
jgi:hypothetical protein